MKPLRQIAAAAITALLAVQSAYGANPCADGGSAVPTGIGGTGRSSEPGGIGGTGHDGDGSGIGGTGEAPGGGIGGTGRGPEDPGEGGIGGTGRARAIVGTVTGYASLCVAGIEVEVDEAALGGDAGDASLPAIGETVEVVAVGEGDRVKALSVSRRPVVVGPVAEVDGKTSTLHVLGQQIAFGKNTHARASDGSDGAMSAETFAPGATVRVSGWRRADGRIEALRVDAAPDAAALVHGTVTKAEGGVAEIDGTNVDVSGLGQELEIGDSVTVSGRASDGRLVATRAFAPIAELVRRGIERLEVESIVTADGRGVAVDSQRLALPSGATVSAGARVRVSAGVGRGGALMLEHLRPAVPPRPPGAGPRLRPERRFHGHPMMPPPRMDRPERPPFPDRPPPRPPRPGMPPPPPPPRILLPERH